MLVSRIVCRYCSGGPPGMWQTSANLLPASTGLKLVGSHAAIGMATSNLLTYW